MNCQCPQDSRFLFPHQSHALDCPEQPKPLPYYVRRLYYGDDYRALERYYDPPEVDDVTCVPDGAAQMGRPYRDLDAIDGSLLGPSVDTDRALDQDYRRMVLE